jgi:hypothetical protein
MDLTEQSAGAAQDWLQVSAAIIQPAVDCCENAESEPDPLDLFQIP